MDRAAIRALARTYLNDPAPGQRWTDAELNTFINDGLTQWAQDSDQLEAEGVPVALADLPLTAFYSAPADFQSITRVEWNGLELFPIDVPWYQNWQTQQGQPSNIIIGPYGPNKFRLFPYTVASQAAVLRVFGTKFAPALVADVDVPAIPEAYHRALTYYCLAEAYLKDSDDSDVALSDKWRGRYAEQVKMAKRQQPITQAYVPMRYP